MLYKIQQMSVYHKLIINTLYHKKLSLTRKDGRVCDGKVYKHDKYAAQSKFFLRSKKYLSR